MDIRKQKFNAIQEHMIQEVKQAKKEGKISHNDIRLLSLSEVADVYNSIKDHLYGVMMEQVEIIKRHHIDAWLENEYYYNKNVYKCFNILKSIGYIGVCGRGLTFENDKIRLTEVEHKRLEQIYFEVLA